MRNIGRLASAGIVAHLSEGLPWLGQHILGAHSIHRNLIMFQIVRWYGISWSIRLLSTYTGDFSKPSISQSTHTLDMYCRMRFEEYTIGINPNGNCHDISNYLTLSWAVPNLLCHTHWAGILAIFAYSATSASRQYKDIHSHSSCYRSLWAFPYLCVASGHDLL